MINCYACRLTNCVGSRIDKLIAVMILVKHPAYVMLPIDLKDGAWFDNEALQVFKRLNELIRPKRLMAGLILGIISLIAIVTSLTASLVALVSKMKSEQFVNDLIKNFY